MLAAIDVGSNTVRMLLGEVVAGRVRPHRYERQITRLKGGQTDEGLAPESMERTFVALQQMKQIADQHHAEKILAVGTEALRSAPDSSEFVSRLKSETSLDLEIISGEEEGRLCAIGVLSALDPNPVNSIIIDIGGGSTELIVVSHQEIVFRYSCPLGVVRIAELDDEQSRQEFISAEIQKLSQCINGHDLPGILADPQTVVVGTAGTITTLAALDMEMTLYDWQKVNNYRMSRGRIDYFHAQLSGLTKEQREELPGMEQGRGDLILPGLNVLQQLLQLFPEKEFRISDFGLLEGLLISLSADCAIH